MRIDKYRKVFAVKGFALFMGLGMLAKLPVVAIPMILTLHVVTGLGRGYAQAGLVISAWTIGVAVASPFQGRLVTRYRLRPVLAISTLAQGVFWGVAPQLPFAVFAGSVCVSGLLLVRGSTVVRLAVVDLVPQELRRTAFTVDSMITEISCMVGPALAVLAASWFSTGAVLVGLAFALVVSNGVLAACYPGAESKEDAAKAPAAAAPGQRWLTSRLLAVLGCAVAAGAIVSGYEVCIVGTLRTAGHLEWSGAVLFGCGVSSLIGGLVSGALPRSLPVPLMIGLLGVATMPVGLARPWWLIALAIAPAAALCAPGYAATATAVSRQAEHGDRATILSVYGSALSAGSSIGAPLAGVALDAGGSEAGFAAVGGFGVIVALAAWAVLGRGLRSGPASAAPPRVPQNVSIDD